jgi:hypothetical protein
MTRTVNVPLRWLPGTNGTQWANAKTRSNLLVKVTFHPSSGYTVEEVDELTGQPVKTLSGSFATQAEAVMAYGLEAP